jgi:hypothetical protein
LPAPLTFDDFVPEVRAFIRDFPELNRIITGQESSNRLINYCANLAVDEFNTMPPLTRYGITNFPSRNILLYLTICHLLFSVGILKSRNRFQYSDGGWSSDTEQQDTLYLNWIRLLRGQITPQAQALKIALNIEGGWGAGVGSEYGWIHGWYGLS